MSTFLNRNPYRRARGNSFFAGFDPILSAAVAGLLVIGTLLVYAATRDWYSANGLDPEYYLKRHVINIVIGLALAWGPQLSITDYFRAYTPFIWGFGVLGLIFVLIPGVGSEVNGAKAWIRLPAGFQIQPGRDRKKFQSLLEFPCCYPSAHITLMNRVETIFSKLSLLRPFPFFSSCSNQIWVQFLSSAHLLSPSLAVSGSSHSMDCWSDFAGNHWWSRLQQKLA
jgi:hypothetical protein